MLISVALGFVDCTQPAVGVVLLTIGVGMIGCQVGAGYEVNINEIGGKNFSGILYGVSNTFGVLPGLVAPYLVGLLTPKVKNFSKMPFYNFIFANSKQNWPYISF